MISGHACLLLVYLAYTLVKGLHQQAWESDARFSEPDTQTIGFRFFEDLAPRLAND